MDPCGTESSITISVFSNFFLFLLIMGMAGTTDVYVFRERLSNYRGIGTGVICQFVLLPFLGFAAVFAFRLERIFGIMLLIVTTSPGGGFSGWWCSIGNADLALSVAMTTVSTVLSIAMLPLNIFIYVQAVYGLRVELPWVGIMTSVGVVIAAVIVGLLLGTRFPKYKRMFNRAGSFGGVANIVLALWVSSLDCDDGESTSLWENPPEFFIAIMSPCILGLIIAFIIARLLKCSGPEAVAICIECCYQNTALAITVAVSAFSPAEAARATVVPLLYGFVEIVVIAIFVLVAWKVGWTYAPRNINILKCFAGNFQPDVLGKNDEEGDEAPKDGEAPPARPKAAAADDPGSPT